MGGNPDRVRDLHRLAEIWRGLGLRVRTIPGWEKRGRASDNTFEVLGCHHTAIVVDSDRLLVDGSSKVPGPLCNVALHANGDVVLVASGLANHFGCATWPNGRSLGVEATGPLKTRPRFPNYDAYVRLAAGFCIFKGNADPRRIVKRDAGIPVRLVAAHKEVAVGVADANGKLGRDQCEATRKIYGRKVDPDFEDPGPLSKGALAHGFSVRGSGVRHIDRFRDRVHARMTEEDISIVDKQTEEYLDKQFKAIRDRVDRAVQRIGGRANSVYNNNNEAFQGLVMAQEALAVAKAARAAAQQALAQLAAIRPHLPGGAPPGGGGPDV
jgi:hypothetical protein